MIKTFDNRINVVGDDLKNSIGINSKLSVASSIFSIYGFESLKKELSKIEELRFIFTDPTFVKTDQNRKDARFFEISSLNRQKSINGSDFEINLKNELKGRTIAKECRKWCEQKVRFKSNKGNGAIAPMLIVDNDIDKSTYLNLNEFSSAGFGYKKDNTLLGAITKMEDSTTTQNFLTNFDNVWNDKEILKDITDEVISYIDNLYKENSPEFIYYLVLYHIFNEFLEDLSEDELANEKTGFKDSVIWSKLYDFQKDAVLGLINKLEKFNGCILADSVGLGKTFSALGVIKYYQERNKSILVLCPKKLGDNWKTFLNNYDDNPLLKDRFNYDVLYHTDILREKGFSNGIDLSRVNWSNYDLIVIDESHNFRNNDARKKKITRYQKLLNIIKTGVRTKLLMLSATPVNNRFTDLKNQIALAYEGQTNLVDTKLNISTSIDAVLRKAQKTFNDWSDLSVEQRTTQNLLKELNKNYDFFKLLDSITMARSRRHIEKYYNMSSIGKFPTRLKPRAIHTNLTELNDIMSIEDIYKRLSSFNMSVYSPFSYIFSSRLEFYSDLYDTDVGNNSTLKQSSREESLKKLMRVNFLKRLESSVDSFRITLNNFSSNIIDILDKIDDFETNGLGLVDEFDSSSLEDSEEDWLDEEFSIGKKVQINLADMDTKSWRVDLENDLEIAQNILKDMNKILPSEDTKLNKLKEEIQNKLTNPINENNNKIIIFTAFAHTANYLYTQLKEFNLSLGLQSAKITGSGTNQTTLNIDKQFNNILSHFSPLSKSLNLKDPTKQIDVLIATDCISEGQNLQDCDTLINYDIHWNPVRIIQRFGRVDRIGSKNNYIQLINFWPNLSLDEYINLKNRVETRMFMVDTTATGEDNVLTNESTDMDFRKQQLQKLQSEVVDIEDMDNSISITDLGLNDFRMDLLNYIEQKGDIANVSNGIHTVCQKDTSKNLDDGVIFVLKNINQNVNIDNTNQLHPFYLVHINKDAEVISNHLSVKNILDTIRYLCKGKDEPIASVYEPFNEETKDGKNMGEYSSLLNEAISSIIDTKDETDIESLFSSGGTSILENEIKGLDDFELIAFIVIR
ncbi:SNF2 family DNA or RNA helicase [Malaciobacter marinus]|uniref:SNF2 family DNA or RNA helicase n=1 Tax=Malaciobacter marinus TaxID=505249 RepID=A0AB36ZRM2_9BACT|nr:helicase-related protein [Malaciobacter marinus]PPK57713.1 SNF2 family DNA or RNA helicase [Malaciobacter marinus]